MADDADAEVARVRALAAHVGASRRHANDLVELIALCSSDEPRVALAAVQSCRALFDGWSRSADLVAAAGVDSGDATGVYRRWLADKYAGWLDTLGVLVARHESMGVRLPALDTLLHMARGEAARVARDDAPRTATLGRVDGALGIACSALTACASCEPVLLAHLKKGYLLQFCDVSYYVTQHAARLAERLGARNRCTAAKCARVLDVLMLVRPPAGDFDPAATRFLALEALDAGAVPARGTRKRAAPVEAVLPADARRLLSARVHRLAFQAAWLALLKLPLARADVRRVLLRCEERILPHFARPLLLSGYLLQAYSGGGLLSLLALSSLHVLMQEHNLECPDFFAKLYALLDERALRSAYRERFFLMCELFLSSALLPAHLTAAFAKRLARLAFHAPPDGCQIALALALNLLIRHPELCSLVHRAPALGGSADGETAAGGDAAAPADARPPIDGDPYLPNEPLPERSRALESSLWEVESLRAHYLPAVSQLAHKFALQMHGAGAKVGRLDVDDFTAGSFASLTRQELRWRKGRPTALAYRKRRALFADDEPGAAGLACFSVVCGSAVGEAERAGEPAAGCAR